MYLPEGVGRELADLKPGESFTIEKRVNGCKQPEWSVSRTPQRPATPGQGETADNRRNAIDIPALPLQRPQSAVTLIEQAGALDAPHGLDETNTRPMPKGPATALERALKTAVTAAAEAEKHGQQIGYNVRFTPADVRALGITVYIGQQSGRAA